VEESVSEVGLAIDVSLEMTLIRYRIYSYFDNLPT
jgi:hypothetical protein